MTWTQLQFLIAVYLLGIVLMHRQGWSTILYVWGALGFTFLALHTAALLNWDYELAVIEARHTKSLMALAGTELDLVDEKILLVPDSGGWVGLNVTLECSTLTELSVFGGLLLFYPRLTLQQRVRYLIIGIFATYLINLLRITVIVGLVRAADRDVLPMAHNLVARLVFFVGVITVYWFLLTRPTLFVVRRSIETQGLGVD